MVPTLTIGDHILVSKMSYGLQWPADCRVGEWFRIGIIPIPTVNCNTSKYVMSFGAPQRGDVIVFRFPAEEEKDFIKRIVGLPGDTVEVRNKRVWINGELLVETYPQFVDQAMVPQHGRCRTAASAASPHHNECRDNIGPWTVPDNSYFVMGDNRDQSMDSRFWGFVKLEKIKGKAFLIYWSWNGQGPLSKWVRWERLGKTIR